MYLMLFLIPFQPWSCQLQLEGFLLWVTLISLYFVLIPGDSGANKLLTVSLRALKPRGFSNMQVFTQTCIILPNGVISRLQLLHLIPASVLPSLPSRSATFSHSALQASENSQVWRIIVLKMGLCPSHHCMLFLRSAVTWRLPHVSWCSSTSTLLRLEEPRVWPGQGQGTSAAVSISLYMLQHCCFHFYALHPRSRALGQKQWLCLSP